MPYSKSLGLVFVAIPKTGTTSVTRAMHDISKPFGGLQLVNEYVDDEYRRKYRLHEIGDNKPGRAKHLSALQIKYILGDEEFERCTKFSVVRNPWARMVSRFFFTHKQSEPSDEDKIRRGTTRVFHDMEFEAWIESRWKRYKSGKRTNSQWGKLVDKNGTLLVDRVGRLEDVQPTLDWVTDTVGVERVQMPHVNGTRKGHYVKFYNDATREMVADMCGKDIEFFDYQFDE